MRQCGWKCVSIFHRIEMDSISTELVSSNNSTQVGNLRWIYGKAIDTHTHDTQSLMQIIDFHSDWWLSIFQRRFSQIVWPNSSQDIHRTVYHSIDYTPLSFFNYNTFSAGNYVEKESSLSAPELIAITLSHPHSPTLSLFLPRTLSPTSSLSLSRSFSSFAIAIHYSSKIHSRNNLQHSWWICEISNDGMHHQRSKTAY